MNTDMKEFDADTMELAETLCKLAGGTAEENIKAVETCIYGQLRTAAQNPYNSDYWRAFYKTFVNAMENAEERI